MKQKLIAFFILISFFVIGNICLIEHAIADVVENQAQQSASINSDEAWLAEFDTVFSSEQAKSHEGHPTSKNHSSHDDSSCCQDSCCSDFVDSGIIFEKGKDGLFSVSFVSSSVNPTLLGNLRSGFTALTPKMSARPPNEDFQSTHFSSHAPPIS